MKFPLQYAKILSQKFLNIDDDIIPEIERCLEREGDKANIPYEVENFEITIGRDNYDDNCLDSDNNSDGYGDGYNYNYGYGNGDGYGNGNGFVCYESY